MIAGLETFAKVRALHDRTDNPGEKAAAAGRMEALARTAGMTVAEALSKLDAPAPTGGGPSFSDIFDSPFFRQAKADADRERAEKWRRVLAEYGSEEAVFAPCEWELALERACDPYVVRKKTTGWPMGSLWGWHFFSSFKDPAPQIVEAIRSAYPMPETVRQAWAEFAFWDKLGRDREARGTGCGDHRDWVYFRVQLVERLLNTLPAAGLADLRARMDWMDWRNDLESASDPKEERVRLATLRADIERMGARLKEEAAPQNGGAGSAAPGGSPVDAQGLRPSETGSSNGSPIRGDQSGTGPEGAQNGQRVADAKDAHSVSTPDAQRVSKTSSSTTAPPREGLSSPAQDGREQGGGEAPPPLDGVGYATDPIASGLSKHVQNGQSANPKKSGERDSASQTGPVRRTNADKRRDVLAFLQSTVGFSDSERLSDREIARRAGVSPQTVGNIRRSLS